MFRRRQQRDVPELNTTSTADISFMLLIFFLVASSMDDVDKVMPRQLPPPEESTQVQELVVKQRNALVLKLDADNRLTCNDEAITPEALTKRVEEFVANASNDPSLPEKSRREVNLFGLCEVSDKHVIMIDADSKAPYDAYFQMQNAIARGYMHLRNQLAMKHFGRPLTTCTPEEREAVQMVYPQRISDRSETEEGGES